VLNDHDPIEGGDRDGAGRVTAFERRSRWLLRAYRLRTGANAARK
jgi:hypothetical protein